MPRFPRYRACGFEWLKEVPEHWEVRPLKYVVVLRSGGTPSKANPDYWDGDVPWASSKDLKAEWLSDTKDHITRIAVDDGAAELVPANCLLIVVRGMILIHTFPVVRTRVPMAINQDLKAITPGPKFNVSFLAWLLRGVSQETLGRIDEAAHGTKVLRLDTWTSIPLPIPPLHEQFTIADFLDRETAKIDALVEEQRRLVELLKEKRQAVISHAVTKGLRPDAPMKASGLEWPRRVPATWTVKRLKHLVARSSGIQIGPFGGMLLDLDLEDSGFKVYGQENIISGDFSRGRRWISNDRFAALSNYRIDSGDLLLTRKGSLGNARLVQELPSPGIIDSDTIRVRVNEDVITPSFLELLLHNAEYIVQQIALFKRGAILSGLNSETIANLSIVLPPMDEQRALLNAVSKEVATIDEVHSNCERSVQLLLERRMALISAAVTGQIDVRGVADGAEA